MPNNRLPLIAGNWKMNTTVEEARALASSLVSRLRGVRNVEILLCPPFISLVTVGIEIRGTNLKLGAQNVHHEGGGAFTGEVSLAMLDGLCSYVIIGHSERRQLFGEKNKAINNKIRSILTRRMTPILCVGETLEQRESNKTTRVLQHQVSVALMGCLGRMISSSPMNLSGPSAPAKPPPLSTPSGPYPLSETLFLGVWEAGLLKRPAFSTEAA